MKAANAGQGPPNRPDSVARSRLPHVLMMHGLCNNSLITTVPVCCRAVGRSGALAICAAQKLYAQSLDEQ
jgi:hypothetical protein